MFNYQYCSNNIRHRIVFQNSSRDRGANEISAISGVRSIDNTMEDR